MLLRANHPHAPVYYDPGFIETPDMFFERLLAEVDWERRENVPRGEIWMNPLGTPYTYGRGAGERTYEARRYHPLVAQVAARLSMISIDLDACFLNRYNNEREALGWHADDSPEIDDDAPIAVISFGAERDIMFREQGGGEIYTQRLAHGSLFLMLPGMQETHEHKIPKHSEPCGPRISLTFRGLVAPKNEFYPEKELRP